MPAFLWKIEVVKQGQGKVARGMSVDIVIRDTTRSPSGDEIADALNEKYHIDCSGSTIHNWIEIERG